MMELILNHERENACNLYDAVEICLHADRHTIPNQTIVADGAWLEGAVYVAAGIAG